MTWRGNRRRALPYRVAALLISVLAAPIACGAPSGTVRIDVAGYLERAKSWAPVEAETAATVRRIFRTQFVDEAEVNRQITDSRPRVERHLVQVREYEPRSDEVERIHREYVRAWEALLAGYDAIQRGFETGDYRDLARGREALEAWRGGIVWVADELRQLAAEYNVDPAAGTVSRGPTRPRGRADPGDDGRVDPAASYSPTRRPCSTIGAGGLNGRVRDGNGCFPSAITAGNRIRIRHNLDGAFREQARGSSPGRIYGQASRPFSTG